MNRQRLLKEVRVLLPAWVCSAALIVGPECFLQTYPYAANLCWVMFVTGCTLLGVLSFGVEYESQTMPAFLSQPVSRRTLWNEKIWILAAALLGLYAVFLGTLAIAHRFRPDTDFAAVHALGWMLAPLCALAGGPCFTLSRRNTLYGAVLTILLPILILAALGGVLNLTFLDWQDGSSHQMSLIALAGYALFAFVLGRRRFLDLEQTDARGWRWRLPAWFLSWAPAKGFTGTIPALVRKEFRLQVGGLVTAMAVWLVALAVFVGSGKSVLVLLESSFFNGYLPFVALVIGSLAIARERSLGTLDWQLTLPVSRLGQWIVKLAVVAAIAALVGALPVIVVYPVTRAVLGINSNWPFEWSFAFTLYGLLLAAALFCSSLSTNPIRAMILTVCLVVSLAFVGLFVGHLTDTRAESVQLFVNAGLSPLEIRQAQIELRSWLPLIRTVALCCLAALLLLLLLLSFLNYRQNLVRASRIRWQIGMLVVTVSVLFAIHNGLYTLTCGRIMTKYAHHASQAPDGSRFKPSGPPPATRQPGK